LRSLCLDRAEGPLSVPLTSGDEGIRCPVNFLSDSCKIKRIFVFFIRFLWYTKEK